MHIENNELIPDGIGDYLYTDKICEMEEIVIYQDNLHPNTWYWRVSVRYEKISNSVYIVLIHAKYIDDDNYRVDPSITRISLIKPEYIVYSDCHYKLSYEDCEYVIPIIYSSWDNIVNYAKDLCPNFIISNMPDYSKLPVEG